MKRWFVASAIVGLGLAGCGSDSVGSADVRKNVLFFLGEDVGVNLGSPGSESHGGGDVMLFSSGAGSSIFKGTLDNTKVFGLQPHRTEGFKLSTDPFFVEKLRDVVGLYLSPPDNALVICVDEKSQCQALERTQPMLPMGLGYAEDVPHDYKRHGTTTLFAALNVLNGAVLASCKPRHRHQEFLSFLREIDKAVPSDPRHSLHRG